MSKKRICIFGSTGSIGTQTLDVCQKLHESFDVVGLACNNNVAMLDKQCTTFDVKCKRTHGQDLVSLIDECEPDIVVNALVGSAGLMVSYETLNRGIRLALANKESLVIAGDLLMPLVKERGQLMPIDSEHGAIFQCLLGEDSCDISKLLITASGGPFFCMTPKELESATSDQALKHPTWAMGPKITIDSATLMNKGLEVIEAHHLFNVDYDDIEVVVQRESVIHSMVEFKDGSVKAHLGTTDMRIPIQYALTYPKRDQAPVQSLDFTKLGTIHFDAPDLDTFECLKIAYNAGRDGGVMPCAMNAANEVANLLFRENRCSFLDIAKCVKFVMSKTKNETVQSLEQLLEIDKKARELAKSYLER